MIKIYSRYDKPARKGTNTGKDSPTQQHMANEVNINMIMAKAKKTGQMPVFQNMNPMYGDVSDFGSYQEALMQIQSAQNDFNALPGAIKARFGHNPGNLLQFLSDENNREEAVKLGLIPKKEEKQQVGEVKPVEKPVEKPAEKPAE